MQIDNNVFRGRNKIIELIQIDYINNVLMTLKTTKYL